MPAVLAARVRRALAVVALALPAALAGCTPTFEEVWQVTDLRLLALRADPPEVLVAVDLANLPATFPLVRVTALAVDPRSPQALVDWTLYACTADENRCELADRQQLVQRGRSRLDQLSVDFALDRDLALAAITADPLKGFGGVPVMVELQIARADDPRAADRAVKRLVYGLPLPPQKTANQNPTPPRVTVDGKDPPASWTVAPETKLKLLPVSPAADKEHYWVATYTGGTRELDEFLSYAFFVTAGQLSDAVSGGKPSPFVTNKKVDDLSSDWTPPKASVAGAATMWIVVRDDRGGVAWTSLQAQVK